MWIILSWNQKFKLFYQKIQALGVSTLPMAACLHAIHKLINIILSPDELCEPVTIVKYSLYKLQ